MSPPVTIITVTYNRKHILPASVKSVLAQDYEDLRLLIVDDGSTDGTAELLESIKADPRVRVLRHDTNRGVIAARNTALANLDPTVAYFGYNDSDDMLLPGALRTAVDAIEAHGARYSMVYAWSKDAATGELQGHFARRGGEITMDDYLDYRIDGDWFQLVRRDLAGSMRYDDRAGGGEGILWARILREKPALLIDQVLQLKDRSGTDRVGHARYDQAAAQARMRIYLHELAAIGEDMRLRHPKSYALLLSRLAHAAAMAGDGRRARLASRQALRMDADLRTLAIVVAAIMPGWVARGATRALRLARPRPN